MKLKKVVSVLLTLSLCCSLCSVASAADATTFTSDNIQYSVVGESQVAVSGVAAEATSVTIPATVTNEEKSYDVVRVSQMGFVAQNYAPNTTLTTITFAENSNVEEIGLAAFANCTALTSITLPDSEVSIGEAVFANCISLESVEIPANATLAPMVFGGHPYFGSDQFYGDDKITFAEGSPYQIADGILYDETSLLHVYDESVEVVDVPEGITTIDKKAFAGNKTLKTVTLPTTVTALESGAFQNCTSLESVILLGDIQKIGGVTFDGCTALKTVEIPNSVAEIETNAFRNCSALEAIDLPEGLKEIGESTFENCSSLKKADLPSSLTTLGESAFSNCSSLTQVEIPSGVSEIPFAAFGGCLSLESVTISEGVTKIGDYAFDLTIEENDEFVNPNPQLQSINIPSTVTNVGENFLGGIKANGGTALIFEGTTPPDFADDALAGISGNGANKPTVYYPAGAEDAYTAENSDLVTGGLVSKPAEGETPDNQYALSITEDTVNVKVGKTVQLTVASTIPTGATLEWSSSNDQVATVSNGTITGVKAGSATITASIQLNGITLVSDSCTVTVTAANVPVAGVTLDKTSLSLTVGGEATLKATVAPENATNQAVSWSTSDATVATVENGTVTAVAEGTATITVTTEDGGKTATCTVTVSPVEIPATGITLDKTSMTLYVDEEAKLTATVTPVDSTDTVIWSSSNEDVATVDENGIVTAHRRGEATITARAGEFTASCQVEVIRRPSSGGDHDDPDYAVTVDKDMDNGTVTVSPKRAEKGDTVTITVKPDKGYELDELIVTDSKGREIDLREKGDNKFTFKMPGSKVTVEATFRVVEETPEKPEVVNPFVDVNENAYYHDAALWAVEKGITGGTSAATFSPDDACTRAQMVTFLWRAAGSPVVNYAMSFTDVPADAYYAEAVRWAVSQGITAGTSATTFDPNATVTRGQTVTFLWRAAGSPVVNGDSFADVAADTYYAPAVAWAVREGITSGVGAETFAPSADCTRGQIVTFLYRDMAK